MNSEGLHAVILAAGASTRFGSPKQLAPIDGVPMLRLVLNRALAVAGNSVSVVLGANASDLAPLVGRSPATVVVNRNWSEGLAASIRAGILQLPGSCAAALLLLADQTAVTAEDLTRLADAWRRNRTAIVAAQYQGGFGVPAIFPRQHFPALLALRGDSGARALLRGGAANIVGVPMPSAAHDVDRPADLANVEPGAEERGESPLS